MSNGSLADIMAKEDYKFSWKRVIRFAIQIIKGLNCLHMWKPCIVHRDLKCKKFIGG